MLLHMLFIYLGRDASLAFITGEFNDNNLIDDISSLSIQQVKALNDWVQFYNKNYIYKGKNKLNIYGKLKNKIKKLFFIGKLNGKYYNEDGSPTKEFYNVQKILIEAKEKQFEEVHKKQMFPPCNIEWKLDSGTVVWCTKKR